MSFWPRRFADRRMPSARAHMRIAIVICASLMMTRAARAQSPGQIVEYKEVVPVSAGQIRDKDVCINFSPVMTAGDFFDGLQRHETASGDQFRKNSQVVTTFPDQITVQ